jgi:hypothetical protein
MQPVMSGFGTNTGGEGVPMLRRHHLAVLALALASSPLAAQQAAPPLPLRPAEWTASAPAPAVLDAVPADVSIRDAAPAEIGAPRSIRRVRPAFHILTAVLGMVIGGTAGGTVMSQQCSENCGVKAFYGAIGGSSLGFTLGFTLGRAAEGGDPTLIPNVPIPVNMGS